MQTVDRDQNPEMQTFVVFAKRETPAAMLTEEWLVVAGSSIDAMNMIVDSKLRALRSNQFQPCFAIPAAQIKKMTDYVYDLACKQPLTIDKVSIAFFEGPNGPMIDLAYEGISFLAGLEARGFDLAKICFIDDYEVDYFGNFISDWIELAEDFDKPSIIGIVSQGENGNIIFSDRMLWTVQMIADTLRGKFETFAFDTFVDLVENHDEELRDALQMFLDSGLLKEIIRNG